MLKKSKNAFSSPNFNLKVFNLEIVCLIVVLSGTLVACLSVTTPESTVTGQPSAISSMTSLPETKVEPEHHPLPTPADLVITIPNGNLPVLDGTLFSREWNAARKELFSDGSQLLMMHHAGYLYLGIQANTTGMIVGNVFVEHEDKVSVLHSSAALGTAIYEKRSDGFQQNQDFLWQCRNTGNSSFAQAEREAFLQQEGWLASNSRMGSPQELEYKIAMPNGSLRLAVTFTRASELSTRIYWPIGLEDDCTKSPQGEFPTTMQFAPFTWATVKAADISSIIPAAPTPNLSDYAFPKSIDTTKQYMFYLHGKIIEDQGIPAISPDYGHYEYEAILEKLSTYGFAVISEQRPKDTDGVEYARRITGQVTALLDAGVPAKNITVVGASKGASIAIFVSHFLVNEEINYVILAICHPNEVANLKQNQIFLYGNILSIYDSVDEFAGSCQELFSFSEGKGLSRYEEIVLSVGTGHGILYQPLDVWLLPTVQWAGMP
jgi:hypothetical protein